MPQDFSGQNLRGRSFKGQDLSEASFAGADIRGANFTNATLIGANFRGAEAGLQRRWVVVLLAYSWLLAGVSGFFLIAAVSVSVSGSSIGFGAITLAIALAIALAVAEAGAVAGVFIFTVAGAVAGAFAGTIVVAFAITLTGATFTVGAVALVLASAYVWWAGDEKKAVVPSFAVIFAATGGTSFRGADLTDANFNGARLKSTDFRNAILTRTCWHNTKMLDSVLLSTTYLQNPLIRQVLVTGLGQDKNFDRQDLRGVNFQGANLTDTSFISADLSGANLQDADLSRAKLVKTQLDETDLTGATLTGACIEDWGITTHTKLNGVRCEYIFMRHLKPKDLDQNRRRKPDNWEEKFEDGDFADFIKPIVDTLDLYHNQDVDPRAIAIAFKQLAENHPDAELEIAAMEKRGQDKFLLRAKTAPMANKSELSAEYIDTYNQVKSLPQREIQLLEEKDSRIRSLENFVTQALQRPNFYSNVEQVGFMSNNPGGFSVGGSVGGNLNNVQGDNNRTVQGDNNHAVQGNNNQVTQQNQVGDGAEASLTKDDIIKLLAELETLIRGAEIPAEPKAGAIEDLSATKNATDKEEPNKARALARLDSVAETLEKTSKTVDSGKKLWSTAKPIISKIAGWLGAAAGSHLLS